MAKDLGRVGKVMGRTLLLGAAAMLLSGESSCEGDHHHHHHHDDDHHHHDHGGVSRIEGDVHVSFSHDDHVHVHVLGGHESTETDFDGDFSLEDSVAGPLTLFFDRSDGVSADLDVPPFPRGAVVTLDDVDLDLFDDHATYDVASLSFAGRVTEVRCGSATIFIEGTVEPIEGDFPIRTTDARISDRNDDVVNCSTVRVGDDVDVRGRLEPNGAITHASVSDRDLPR